MANKKFPAVYEHSYQQANERGESKEYFASLRLNSDCAKAIDAALAKHYDYDSCCLNTAAAAKEVAGQFGTDRMMYVLASTVRFHEHDGRFSRDNKEWAQTMPAYDNRDMSTAYLVGSHPGLTNLLVNQVRHELLLAQPHKPSIKEKLTANTAHSERPAAQEHQKDKGAR